MADQRGNDAAVETVLARLHDLAQELGPLERSVLGVLLGPGISAAFEHDAEVSGFGLVSWSSDALPRAVRAAIERQPLDLLVGEDDDGAS